MFVTEGRNAHVCFQPAKNLGFLGDCKSTGLKYFQLFGLVFAAGNETEW